MAACLRSRFLAINAGLTPSSRASASDDSPVSYRVLFSLDGWQWDQSCVMIHRHLRTESNRVDLAARHYAFHP